MGEYPMHLFISNLHPGAIPLVSRLADLACTLAPFNPNFATFALGFQFRPTGATRLYYSGAVPNFYPAVPPLRVFGAHRHHNLPVCLFLLTTARLRVTQLFLLQWVFVFGRLWKAVLCFGSFPFQGGSLFGRCQLLVAVMNREHSMAFLAGWFPVSLVLSLCIIATMEKLASVMGCIVTSPLAP